ESVGCAEWSSGSTGPCDSGIDQLVLGTDADTAAHTFVFNNPLGPSVGCQSVEQIVANDSTGTHILDSITATTPYSYTDPRRCARHAPSKLSPRSSSGHPPTWTHAGTLESAQLNCPPPRDPQTTARRTRPLGQFGSVDACRLSRAVWARCGGARIAGTRRY